MQGSTLLCADLLEPHAIVQIAVLRLPAILEVIIPRSPRPSVTALGHLAQAALDIRTTKWRDALGILLLFLADGRNSSRIPIFVHVLDDSAEQA